MLFDSKLLDAVKASEPQYLNWPPYIPKSMTPLCERFVDPPVWFDSTIRVIVDEGSAMRVWLRSEKKNSSAIEIASVDVDAATLKGGRDALIARANNILTSLLAKADYQLAAYCASDLWC